MANDEDRPQSEGHNERGTPLTADEIEALERRALPDEIGKIFEAHGLWLESLGVRGEKARLAGEDLSNADLRGAVLSKADLRETNLSNAYLEDAEISEATMFSANLTEANLHSANLEGADLRGAKLQNCTLVNTILRDANLQDADLRAPKGLLAGQLAGADVSGAILPEDIAKFDGLSHVEETSKNARKIFFVMLLACVYSWLTIATTTDAALLTNSASSPLPIIQTKVPIAGFYWAAPLILISLYLYLHLYLQRLWHGLAALPAVFPDGKALDEKAYPWLLNGLVRANFRRLKDHRLPLSYIENFLSILLAWWIVPLTLVLFWGRYIPRHDWIGTGLHITHLVVSTGFGLLLYRFARATLRGNEFRHFRWKRRLLGIATREGASAIAVGVLVTLVSLGAIEGIAKRELGNDKILFGSPETWVPRIFQLVGYRTYADLHGADVSTKPEDWWKVHREKPEQLDGIKGAALWGRDLRYARASEAFLAKAKLVKANLQGAWLMSTNLQGAILVRANLQGSMLIGANLQGANLQQGNLQGANLNNANLQGADLRGARNLTQAQLGGACGNEKTKLPQDLWIRLCLERADLMEILEAHRKWVETGGGDGERADLYRRHIVGVNLEPTDLIGANLQGANLQEAILMGTNIRGANLRGADLRGADLRFTISLTQDQLDEACGDERTKLPDELAVRPCPD